MKRNRIIAMVLALLMVMSLCACSAKEAAPEFKRGVVDGNIYTNEMSGISFTAPDGYYYYSDEEIAEVQGTGGDAVSNVIYDMVCASRVTGATFSINYEVMSDNTVDEKEYIDLSKAQIESVFENNDNISIKKFDNTTTEINGKTLNCANVVIEMGEASIYETLVIKAIDGYMVICTASSVDEADIDLILSNLSFK